MGEIRANVETQSSPWLGLHIEQFSERLTTRAKQNARERSPFKIAGIALAARMEALAGITGSGAG